MDCSTYILFILCLSEIKKKKANGFPELGVARIDFVINNTEIENNIIVQEAILGITSRKRIMPWLSNIIAWFD